MILVAVVGGGLGWWGYLARRQAAAVATIRSVEPQMLIDYDDDPSVRPWWIPMVADRWLGVDYLFRVRWVGLVGEPADASPGDRRRVSAALRDLPHLKVLNLPFPVDDEDVASLAWMAELERLTLGPSNPGLTDRGMAVIGRLDRLECLELGDTSATDAGMAELGRLGRLGALAIGDAPITDAGVAHLEHLDALTDLVVGVSPIARPVGSGRLAVDGSGFAALARLPRLSLVQFESPSLSGPGLAGFGRLTHLEELDLTRYGGGSAPRPKLGDLRALGDLPKLRLLCIEGFEVGEAGLPHLEGFAGLKSLTAKGLGDESIPALVALPSLDTVSLSEHHLTAKGLATLQFHPRYRNVIMDREPRGAFDGFRP